MAATRASQGEVIDFLKIVVAASEGHLRALDTKAQIALAAFVLSWSPLWSMVNSSCRQGVAAPAMLLIVAFVIVTSAAFGYVIWPSSGSGSSKGTTAGASASFSTEPGPAGVRPSLFYVGAADVRPEAYLDAVRGLQPDHELAREAVALAGIRQRKHLRLRRALLTGAGTYAALAVMLVTRHYCV